MPAIIFLDENNKELTEDEVTDIFRYEDFLKGTILKKNIGQKMLNELQNNTYRQIFMYKNNEVIVGQNK